MSLFDVLKLLVLGACGFAAGRAVAARFGMVYGIVAFVVVCVLVVVLWRGLNWVIGCRRKGR
jgi:hypothetical protein